MVFAANVNYNLKTLNFKQTPPDEKISLTVVIYHLVLVQLAKIEESI